MVGRFPSIATYCKNHQTVEAVFWTGYTLSDVLKHDVSFGYMVLVDIMNKYFADLTVVCIKSDNCRVQYKCKWVFAMLRKLAISYNKMIIWYYGVDNHGKGMLDGMSSFGVKQPMRNEIIKRD